MLHGTEYEISWHNKNITFRDNTLYFKDWFHNDIVFLSDTFSLANFDLLIKSTLDLRTGLADSRTVKMRVLQQSINR